MSVAIAEDELINLLFDNLPSAYTQAKVQTPNAKFATPNNSPYLRITINISNTLNTTATGSRKRTRGIVTVDVFYPSGQGAQQALKDAEEISAVFHNQATTNIGLLESTVYPRGLDNGLYRVQVDTNFYYED